MVLIRHGAVIVEILVVGIGIVEIVGTFLGNLKSLEQNEQGFELNFARKAFCISLCRNFSFRTFSRYTSISFPMPLVLNLSMA